MSDFDDIVAAAGIVIVDPPAPGDGGDADNRESGANYGDHNRQEAATILSEGAGDTTVMLPQVEALEAMFSHRYTMEDEGYAQTVKGAEFNLSPPCVPNFREKRTGDFQRRGRGGRGGWGRDRGGRGYNRHDNYDNRQSYRDREDHYNRNRYDHHRDGGDGYRRHQRYQDQSRSRENHY